MYNPYENPNNPSPAEQKLPTEELAPEMSEQEIAEPAPAEQPKAEPTAPQQPQYGYQPTQNPYQQPYQGFQPYQHTYPQQPQYVYQPYMQTPYQVPGGKQKKTKPAKPKKEAKQWSGKWILKAIAAALIVGILGGACFGGINMLFGTFNKPSDAQQGGKLPSESVQKPQTELAVSGENQDIPYTNVQAGDGTTVLLDVSGVAESVMPAMVSINVVAVQTVDPFGGLFGGSFGGYEQEVSGSGSGIIIGENDKELLIATNNHVVGDAKKIAIEFIDGESVSATVKGTEESVDLAVVSVAIEDLKPETRASIKVAVMGDSDSLKLGEPAIAIGNALGYGQSVTVGYISALKREVNFTDGKMTLLQTDAAINPGNSGGALLNTRGEVIGINSAKYSGTNIEGMGYAIPISDAIPIINELMNAIPESERPYLGILGQDVPESYRDYFGWPEGVYVSEITRNSPAALAGLHAGDIITSYQGETVKTMEGLQAMLKASEVGETVKLTIMRTQGVREGEELKEMELTAVLIARGDVE